VDDDLSDFCTYCNYILVKSHNTGFSYLTTSQLYLLLRLALDIGDTIDLHLQFSIFPTKYLYYFVFVHPDTPGSFGKFCYQTLRRGGLGGKLAEDCFFGH
jgi:hypothetical protein